MPFVVGRGFFVHACLFPLTPCGRESFCLSWTVTSPFHSIHNAVKSPDRLPQTLACTCSCKQKSPVSSARRFLTASLKWSVRWNLNACRLKELFTCNVLLHYFSLHHRLRIDRSVGRVVFLIVPRFFQSLLAIQIVHFAFRFPGCTAPNCSNTVYRFSRYAVVNLRLL